MQTRLDPLLQAAGFDYGALSELEDAVSYALIELGYTVADMTTPTDTELTAVTKTNHYLDLVELRSMETALNRLVIKSDITLGPRSQAYGQISQGLEKAIERKRKQINSLYGRSLSGMGTAELKRYVEE
jgi:hypothetical protein